MDAIQIGRLALPTSALFLLLGLTTFFLVTRWWEKRQKRTFEASMWWTLITGVVVARAAFVLMNWSAYRQDWPSIFYLWQDGYAPLAGIFAALLFAVLHAVRGKHPQGPMLSAMGAGLAVWLGLSLVATELATTHDLPDLVLADLQQEPISLHEYSGQPIVINLWATWCPPCRREMPAFQDAQQANTDVHFLFVNQREAIATVQAFLDQEELDLSNVLLDSGATVAGHFGSRGMPTTLFFDADGRMLNAHLGELSRAQLHHYLKQMNN